MSLKTAQAQEAMTLDQRNKLSEAIRHDEIRAVGAKSGQIHPEVDNGDSGSGGNGYAPAHPIFGESPYFSSNFDNRQTVIPSESQDQTVQDAYRNQLQAQPAFNPKPSIAGPGGTK